MAAAFSAQNKADEASGQQQPPQNKRVRSVIGTPPSEELLSQELSVDDDAPEDIKPDVTKLSPEQRKALEDAKRAKEAQQRQQDDSQQQQQQTPPDKGQQQQQQKGEDKFNYEGFDDAEKQMLKQMSNTAKDFVGKRLKQLRELQAKKPDSYLQHPKAFVLSPEFTEAAELADQAGFEADHWRKQLINIRNGKKWIALVGYDDKTGAPLYSKELNPTDESEIEVSRLMTACGTSKEQAAQKVAALQANFTNMVQADVASINAHRAKHFEWAADPAKLETLKVTIPEMGEVTVGKVVNDFKSLFGGHHRGNPLLDLCADMFAAYQILNSKLGEANAAIEREKRLRSGVQRGEPSLEGGGAIGGAKGKIDVLDMEGLPE